MITYTNLFLISKLSLCRTARPYRLVIYIT